MNCNIACGPLHWCTYCLLEGELEHAVLCKDVYADHVLVAQYPTCADHHGREIPPAGVKEPWNKQT